MTRRYRIVMVLALAMAAVLPASVAEAAPTPAVPAVALATPASCNAHWYLCGYDDMYYQTTTLGWELDPFLGVNVCDNVALPNKWTSFWNSGYRDIRVYTGSNCSGAVNWIKANSGVPRISLSPSWGPAWDDNIASVRF